jgi:hypothetical protein
MKFNIDELPVLFPYPRIYPEQYAYMCDLKSNATMMPERDYRSKPGFKGHLMPADTASSRCPQEQARQYRSCP